MTRDTDFDRALDRFTVPAPDPAFADRIMAAATARPASALPPPRPRRRGWMRGRGLLAGGIAFGLMSATAAAAAAGLFGDTSRLPVIGPVIAAVRSAATPHHAVTPKVRQSAPAKITAPPPAPAVLPGPAQRAEQNHAIAERLVQAIDRRDAVRTARGLPPRRPKVAASIDAFRNATPDQQAAMVEQVRERREARRAAILADRPPEMGPDAPLTRMERRRLMREWRQERRLRAGQAQAAPPDPAPDGN